MTGGKVGIDVLYGVARSLTVLSTKYAKNGNMESRWSKYFTSSVTLIPLFSIEQVRISQNISFQEIDFMNLVRLAQQMVAGRSLKVLSREVLRHAAAKAEEMYMREQFLKHL